MSIPHASYDPRRVFRFSLPRFEVGPKVRSIGTYLSGGLFALSYFFLFDAATISSHAKPPPDAPYDVVPVHMSFVDWIPAICSTLGFLITSLLDKSHLNAALSGDSWGGDGPAAVRARVVLFIGVALMAGGLAGSLTVLILKYIITEYTDYVYYGIMNVAMNGGIMLSAAVTSTSINLPYNLPLSRWTMELKRRKRVRVVIAQEEEGWNLQRTVEVLFKRLREI